MCINIFKTIIFIQLKKTAKVCFLSIITNKTMSKTCINFRYNYVNFSLILSDQTLKIHITQFAYQTTLYVLYKLLRVLKTEYIYLYNLLSR